MVKENKKIFILTVYSTDTFKFMSYFLRWRFIITTIFPYFGCNLHSMTITDDDTYSNKFEYNKYICYNIA